MDPALRMEQETMKFLKPIDAATERGDSEIQRFYQNAVVFVTGGTGFMGKQLLEKLFRSCDIKKAFVLIRPQKGISAQERLKDMLKDPIFLPVCMKKPDIANRLVPVEGDVADFRLGISNDVLNIIVEEVDVIFHLAATVKFDEKIRKATKINVGGTREALDLGKLCKKLRSFVHISTAYSVATKDRIKDEVREQFYKAPVPPETLLTLVENVSEKRLDILTQSLISGWPNTYTFTKAVAEELIQTESGSLPICIVRPSIIYNAYREPLPGWLDGSCKHASGGILLGYTMGVLRVCFVNNNINMSFVPVDFVNNATIVAGWVTGMRGLQAPLIYNVTNNNSTFMHLYNPTSSFGQSYSSPSSLWYMYLLYTKNRSMYWFLSWSLHYIPAYVADAVLNVLKYKKPAGLKSIVHLYKKIDNISARLSYFSMNEWNFADTNLQALWNRMSDTEKIIYNFNMKSIDWDNYALMSFIGTRKYIIKDGLQGTEKGVSRQKWLKLANFAVLFAYLTIFRLILGRLWWLAGLLKKSKKLNLLLA